MSNHEIESKIRELKSLQGLIEEAQAEAEAIRDQIKAHMGDTEEIRAGEYKITWRTVETARLDTAKIRKTFSQDFLEPYTIHTSSRRFVIA